MLGTLNLGGVIRAAEVREIKRRGKVWKAACDKKCINKVRGTAGGTKDIEVVDGKFREIKAAGGRRSALDRLWFGRPFHPDCACGGSTVSACKLLAVLKAACWP